jgi:hypothetical protein
MPLAESLLTAVQVAETIGQTYQRIFGGNQYFGDDAAPEVRRQLENMRLSFTDELEPVSSIPRPTDEEIDTETISFQINKIQNFAQPFLVPFDQTVTVRYEGVANQRSGGTIAVADGVGASIIGNIGGSVQEVPNSRIVRTGVARLGAIGSREDVFEVTEQFNLTAGTYVALGNIIGHELSFENSILNVTITLEKPVSLEDEEIAPITEGGAGIFSPTLLLGLIGITTLGILISRNSF